MGLSITCIHWNTDSRVPRLPTWKISALLRESRRRQSGQRRGGRERHDEQGWLGMPAEHALEDDDRLAGDRQGAAEESTLASASVLEPDDRWCGRRESARVVQA